MMKQNPFSGVFDHHQDEFLVEQAKQGSRQALNQLISRHNNFIYNIALKMLGNPMDAEDATQEILIKLITNLASYKAEKAQLRTWLYRIAFNFLLQYKKSKTEQIIVDFEQFFGFIDTIEDQEEAIPAAWTRETKIKCMTGMLMCIPRADRLLYIVGDFFGVEHQLGAKMFEITPAAFRKRLSRTRQQLREWMNNRCGLVNKANPCSCTRKTKGFIEQGIVNPNNLLWDKGYTKQIQDYSQQNIETILKNSDKVYTALYQTHPFKEHQNAEQVVEEILGNSTIKDILQF